jgi:hypothetical protein
MANTFDLPTEEDCTLIIKPSGLSVDIMQVYDMYTDSRKEAERLGREGPRPHIPIFIEMFHAAYKIELTFSSAVMLIQRVSLLTIDLKKKCEGLLIFSDSTPDSPASSTPPTEST